MKLILTMPILLLMTSLLGCLSVNPRPDVKISLGTNDYFFVPVLLDSTLEAFIGDSALIENTISEIIDISNGGSGSSSGQGQSGDSKTAFSIRNFSQISAEALWRLPLMDDLSLIQGLSLSAGETKVLFPDGIDILIEPIKVKSNDFSAELLSGVEKDFRFFEQNNLVIATNAGVGYRIARSKISIQSPVLDVVHKTNIPDRFVFLGLVLKAHTPSYGITPSFDLKFKQYTNKNYVVIGSVGASF